MNKGLLEIEESVERTILINLVILQDKKVVSHFINAIINGNREIEELDKCLTIITYFNSIYINILKVEIEPILLELNSKNKNPHKVLKKIREVISLCFGDNFKEYILNNIGDRKGIIKLLDNRNKILSKMVQRNS